MNGKVILAALGALAAGCILSNPTDARTPPEFVKKLVGAYRDKNARMVQEMTIDLKTLDRAGKSPAQLAEMDDYDAEEEIRRLAWDMQRESTSYRAWCTGEYKSHKDYDGFVRAEVHMTVGTQHIILVRQPDGNLRLHPRAGWFDKKL
jgi:hypothetical protein